MSEKLEARKLKDRIRAQAWREQNRERHRDYARRYYAEHKPQVNARNAEWAEQNREKVKNYLQLYQKQNLALIRETKRVYRERNRAAVSALSRNYKARKRNAPGSHDGADIERLLALQKGRCVTCRDRLTKYHVDHIVALSRGGSNDASNLQLLCPFCNLSKGAKDPLTFANERGLLL